jgi:hypothetical protein
MKPDERRKVEDLMTELADPGTAQHYKRRGLPDHEVWRHYEVLKKLELL